MNTCGSGDQSSNGSAGGQGPKDEFALVCYLPGALGVFLDHLRTELVESCSARSHVTLLPPRPLNGLEPEANLQLRQALPAFTPFVVELGDVNVFELTKVVYLEVIRGQQELACIHEVLNSNALFYKEPYHYHPHVTLAQGPSVIEDTDRKVIMARDRWASFRQRKFLVESVTFVQNGGSQGWLDLEELAVGEGAFEASVR